MFGGLRTLLLSNDSSLGAYALAHELTFQEASSLEEAATESRNFGKRQESVLFVRWDCAGKPPQGLEELLAICTDGLENLGGEEESKGDSSCDFVHSYVIV